MPHRLLHVMYRERAANAFAFKEHVASHSRARRLSGQSSSTLHTAYGNQEENQRPLGKLWLPNTHRPPVQGHGLRSQSHRLAQGSPRSSPLTRTAAEKSRQCRDSSGHGKASCGSVPRPQGCSGDSPSLSRRHTSESHAQHL